jgi:hypothetical protein
MFGHILGLRFFYNLEGPLARNQVSLPKTFVVISPISTTTITLVAYLRNSAFVASIIATRFMVDQHPFLLEALT